MFKLFVPCLFLFFSIMAEANMVSYTLNADINGYVGVGGEIDGKKNPELTAMKGDMVMITIVNQNDMPHDVQLTAHNVKSSLVRRKGDEAMIHFTAEQDDFYLCSLPGHASAGMKGKFKIQTSSK